MRPCTEPRTGPPRKVIGSQYRGRGYGSQIFLECGHTVLGTFIGQRTHRCIHCDLEERACRLNRPETARHSKGSRADTAIPCFYCEQYVRNQTQRRAA